MYKPIKANVIMIILIVIMATLTTNVKALNIKYDISTNKCIINKKEYSIEKIINKNIDYKNIVCKSYISDNIEEVSSEENVVEENVETVQTNEITNQNEDIVYVENDVYYEKAANYLTASKGVVYFEGHKETYYTEEALPGYSLNIPGRHVAYDGTIRDIDSYIVVAANSAYLAKGTIVNTSLGLAKVYDTGCAYGTIDIYVNEYKFSTAKLSIY